MQWSALTVLRRKLVGKNGQSVSSRDQHDSIRRTAIFNLLMYIKDKYGGHVVTLIFEMIQVAHLALLTFLLVLVQGLQLLDTSTLGKDPQTTNRLNGESFQQDPLVTFNGMYMLLLEFSLTRTVLI